MVSSVLKIPYRATLESCNEAGCLKAVYALPWDLFLMCQGSEGPNEVQINDADTVSRTGDDPRS